MSDSKKHSIGDRIIRASFAVGAAHIILKLTGLIQTRVATHVLDTGTYDAAYGVAFSGIVYTLFLIGEESIGPSFLPVFMDRKDKGDEAGAWRFAGKVMTLQCLILLPVAVLLMLFPATVVDIFSDFGVGDDDRARRELAITSLVWLAPALICLSLGSTTYMLLNGYKRFFLAAFGDSSWKIVTVLAMIVGIGVLGWGLRALLVGLVVGSVAKLGTHLWGLRHELHRLRPSLHLRDPALRSMWLLILPLLVGIVLAKVRDVYNDIYLLSALEQGIVQANNVGKKLFQGISWVVPYTVSIAMFPFFCELVDSQDHKRLGGLLDHASRQIMAVFIPGCVLMAVLAQPLVVLVFQGGNFGHDAAQLAAVSNAIYALVLPAFAVEFILIQGFFANRRMIAITVIGLVFSTLAMVIAWIGIRGLGYTGAWALGAVAAAYTISRSLKVVTMILVLKRSVPMFAAGPTLLFLGRAVILAAAVGGLGWLTSDLAAGPVAGRDDRIVALVQFAAGSLTGAIVFWGGAWLLRLREPFELLQWGRQKLMRRLGGGRAADPAARAGDTSGDA